MHTFHEQWFGRGCAFVWTSFRSRASSIRLPSSGCFLSRRSPSLANRQVLQDVVRSELVAEEYPKSLARLYSWTPDECVPEFYTDPGVFRSAHADVTGLPDLEVTAGTAGGLTAARRRGRRGFIRCFWQEAPGRWCCTSWNRTGDKRSSSLVRTSETYGEVLYVLCKHIFFE